MTLDHGLSLAICPLCHTSAASMTEDALKAGGSWRCSTCDHMWTAVRLATVAAYAAWAKSNDSRRPE